MGDFGERPVGHGQKVDVRVLSDEILKSRGGRAAKPALGSGSTGGSPRRIACEGEALGSKGSSKAGPKTACADYGEA